MKLKINPAFDLLMLFLLFAWIAAGGFLNYAAQEKNEEMRADKTIAGSLSSRSR